jgi:hypothetical protein
MLGKQYGYYPEDPVQAWKVDSNIDANWDLHKRLMDAKWGPEDKREEGQKNFFN